MFLGHPSVLQQVLTSNHSSPTFHSSKPALDTGLFKSVFLFNGSVQKKIGGVAMGLPLAPSFVNVVLAHHLQSRLSDCPEEFKPIYISRYVDDTFVIFQGTTTLCAFLKSRKWLTPIRFNTYFVCFTMVTEENENSCSLTL